MKTSRISFVENATTKEAGIYALRYTWAFTKGVCREIDKFVHRLPWLCIVSVILTAFVINFICVSEARQERDYANKKMVKLQEQVETLSCAVEANGRKE